MAGRKEIKHYTFATYEERMMALKENIGAETTTQDALTEAIEYTIENRMSAAELEQMAKNEKKMGGKHGK